MPVLWLITELSPPKGWVCAPFYPFPDAVSADGNSTTFQPTRGVGTTLNRRSFNPAFKRLLERLPAPNG